MPRNRARWQRQKIVDPCGPSHTIPILRYCYNEHRKFPYQIVRPAIEFVVVGGKIEPQTEWNRYRCTSIGLQGLTGRTDLLVQRFAATIVGGQQSLKTVVLIMQASSILIIMDTKFSYFLTQVTIQLTCTGQQGVCKISKPSNKLTLFLDAGLRYFN